VLVVIALISYAMPTLRGREVANPKRAQSVEMWSFWVMTIGMAIMVLAMTGAGVLQVWLQRMPTENAMGFMATQDQLRFFYWTRVAGGVVFLIGQLPTSPASSSAAIRCCRTRSRRSAPGCRAPAGPACVMDQSEARRFGAAPYYAEQAEENALFGHAFRQRLPLLIKGPTGCGKTRFVEHMAARLGRPLITVSCHDDLSAADLVGRHLIGRTTPSGRRPTGPGGAQGAICYLDEVVEARKDTTVVLHPLADDRRVLPIERTGEQLVAPPEFMLVISYNPGYQNLLKSLKPSTRQRFVALTLPLSARGGRSAGDPAGRSGCRRGTRAGAGALAEALRRLTEHDLEETVSTRLLVMAARLAESGVPMHRLPRRDRRRADRRRRHRSRALAEVVQAVLGTAC
jgi:nitric oxide reductase NorQ protein